MTIVVPAILALGYALLLVAFAFVNLPVALGIGGCGLITLGLCLAYLKGKES